MYYFFFKKRTNKQKDDMLNECMFAHICLFHSALSICHGCRKNSYDTPVPIYTRPLSDAERWLLPISQFANLHHRGESRIPGAPPGKCDGRVTHVSFQVLCIQTKM